MARTRNTSWPFSLKIFGCSVVLQTRWRMVVFPALARPMIRTRKCGVRFRRFCARLRCLSISAAPSNSVLEGDIVAGMPEMVEVMKNEDKHLGGGQCIVWLHVSQRSDVTHSLPVHAHSNLFQLLAEELHSTFVLPFIQFYPRWLKWNFQHIHISKTSTWPVIGFQAQFVHDEAGL